jgi:hypothetical protein
MSLFTGGFKAMESIWMCGLFGDLNFIKTQFDNGAANVPLVMDALKLFSKKASRGACPASLSLEQKAVQN